MVGFGSTCSGCSDFDSWDVCRSAVVEDFVVVDSCCSGYDWAYVVDCLDRMCCLGS